MVLASVLLIQLLATTAHGIRLDRQLHEALSNKQEVLAGDSKAGKPSDAVAHSTSRRCTSNGNCSAGLGAGKARKPLAPRAAAPGAAKHQPATPKRINGDAQSRHAEELATASHAGDSLPQRRHFPPQQKTQTYPDILDIAGMDYSPASRKPPIHN
ncbi:unnamed protein product [Alopecurus aequalis]